MRLSLLLLLFSPAVFAQMLLEGDVVDAASHAPVAAATVAVGVGQAKPLVATTDASGHFRLSIAEPRYLSVSVTRNGFLGYYVPVAYNGELPTSIHVELTRQAVISGKLEDEDGFPVANASVQVYVATDGQPRRGLTTIADDRGEYRIAKLPAGKYYVRASSAQLSFWDPRYWATFYPGTLEPGETGLIELSAGQERGGVDIHFTKHEGVMVSGTIVMLAGLSAPRRLMLDLQSPDYPWSSQMIYLRPDGQSFAMPHVVPGKYSLRVRSGNFPPAAGDWFGEQLIQVGSSDLRDIVLPVRAVELVDLQGAVVPDRGAAPRVTIGLRGDYGPVKSAQTNDDGSFVFKGLVPGTYHVMISPQIKTTAPASITPVFPVAMLLGDKDVTKDGFVLSGVQPPPLRITLASQIGTVRGTLLDSSGQPVVGGGVLFAPAKGSYSNPGGVTGAKGDFIVIAPAGEYRVYAMANANQAASLQDPGYLKAHANDFPPVRIVEGDKNPPLMLRLDRQAKPPAPQ